jgi:curved DNA-binding protein CbpA
MAVAEQDAYVVLGVPRDADDETIATAYRTLARRFHPDIAGDEATRQMMRINAAFDQIRTVDLRLAYDDLEPSIDDRPGPGADGGEAIRRRPERDGTGGAGPPPGRPSGSVLPFGRHIGWSLGEIERVDPGYLLWLSERPEARPYRDELDAILERLGYRAGRSRAGERGAGWGVFRR